MLSDSSDSLISPPLTGCGLLHDLTTFPGHCRRPPELYPKMTASFHENEDILSETRAHIRTFQRQHRTALGCTEVHWGTLRYTELHWGTPLVHIVSLHNCTSEWRVLWLEGQRAEEVWLYSLEKLLSSNSSQKHNFYPLDKNHFFILYYSIEAAHVIFSNNKRDQ